MIFKDITFPKVRKKTEKIYFRSTLQFNVFEVFPIYMDQFSRTNCSILAPTVYENKTIKLTKASSNSSVGTKVKHTLNLSTHLRTLIRSKFVIQKVKAQGMLKSLNHRIIES